MDATTSASARTYRVARKVVITVAGITVVLIGLIMVVLPGPALIVLPAGLALLGLEYRFARRWLQQVRRGGSRFGRWLRRRGW